MASANAHARTGGDGEHGHVRIRSIAVNRCGCLRAPTIQPSASKPLLLRKVALQTCRLFGGCANMVVSSSTCALHKCHHGLIKSPGRSSRSSLHTWPTARPHLAAILDLPDKLANSRMGHTIDREEKVTIEESRMWRATVRYDPPAGMPGQVDPRCWPH
jgi:hypothetical protein